MKLSDWPKPERSKKRVSEIKHHDPKPQTSVPVIDEVQPALAPGRPVKVAPPRPAPLVHQSSLEKDARFLRLVAACAQVTTHYELFLLVQGQLQYFLPQDILIAAWGDFRGQDPRIDVISNVPGVRTNRICDIIAPLAKRLHKSWIDGRARPIVLDKVVDELQACSNDPCTVPCELRGMRLTLVHGIQNKRDGFDSLYIALSRHPVASRGTDAYRRSLAESVIHQIDLAHRKVAALQTVRAQSDKPRPPLLLGAREKEVTYWISQGKTNAEIAQMLGISTNTVKNHVHRIFDKLGANNRTEAVLNYGNLVRAISPGGGEGR